MTCRPFTKKATSMRSTHSLTMRQRISPTKLPGQIPPGLPPNLSSRVLRMGFMLPLRRRRHLFTPAQHSTAMRSTMRKRMAQTSRSHPMPTLNNWRLLLGWTMTRSTGRTMKMSTNSSRRAEMMVPSMGSRKRLLSPHRALLVNEAGLTRQRVWLTRPVCLPVCLSKECACANANRRPQASSDLSGRLDTAPL